MVPDFQQTYYFLHLRQRDGGILKQDGWGREKGVGSRV